MIQLSDSTAIAILAAIAGVYFSITAACSVVICRVVWRKRSKSSPFPPKFRSSNQQEYALSHTRGTKGIRDHSDFVPGGRAGKWRQYVSGQPITCNGTSFIKNGSHHSQERPKLPAIAEVGEGGVEGSTTDSKGTVSDPTTARESTAPNMTLWLEKHKVAGRTNSTKFLLEETDSGSNWTLTSTNGANGSLHDVMVSSLTLTSSLPGPIIAQCGRSDTPPGPRPAPTSRLPSNAHSESHADTASGLDHTSETSAASEHQPVSPTVGPKSDSVSSDTASKPPSDLSDVNNKPQVRRVKKQLSVSTHSLPRHTSCNPHPLSKQISTESALPQGGVAAGSCPKLRRYASTAPCSSSPNLSPRVLCAPIASTSSRPGSRNRNANRASNGSDTLPRAGVHVASRPKLRRYASISSAPYSSSPNLSPKVLVSPIASHTGSRNRDVNQANTVDSPTLPHHSPTTTIVELERNYFTLQTRRGGVGAGEQGGRGGEGGKEDNTEIWTSSQGSALREERSTELEIEKTQCIDQNEVPVGKKQMFIVVDMGHDGQDSSFA